MCNAEYRQIHVQQVTNSISAWKQYTYVYKWVIFKALPTHTFQVPWCSGEYKTVSTLGSHHTAHFTETIQINPIYSQGKGPSRSTPPAYSFILVCTLQHCQPTQSGYHQSPFFLPTFVWIEWSNYSQFIGPTECSTISRQRWYTNAAHHLRNHK